MVDWGTLFDDIEPKPSVYSFSLKHLLIAVTCICIVTAVYQRGSQLIDAKTGGVMSVWTVIALLILVVGFSITQKNTWCRWLYRSIAIVFASVVLIMIVFPAQLFPGLKTQMQRRILEQETESKLQSLVLDDRRFDGLLFKCRCSEHKVINVSGTLKSVADFRTVRRHIFEHVPSTSRNWLFWDVEIESSGISINQCDLFVDSTQF